MSPTVFREAGFRFYFFSREELRMHIQCAVKQRGSQILVGAGNTDCPESRPFNERTKRGGQPH